MVPRNEFKEDQGIAAVFGFSRASKYIFFPNKNPWGNELNADHF